MTYVREDGHVEVQERELPVPGQGTVVIRTLMSAVCGSDLHRFRCGSTEATDTIGHETVGVVVAAADTRFAVGTHVLHVPRPEVGRTFAEFQLADADALIPVPAELPAAEAVYAQQLGTVLFALSRFMRNPAVVSSALVIGAGPAGVLFLRALADAGVTTRFVIEPLSWRRAVAETSATEAFTTLDDFRETARNADLVIDCSGDPRAQAFAIEVCAAGGSVGYFGIPDDPDTTIDLPTNILIERSLSVFGIMDAQLEPGLTSFRRAVDLIASGRIQVSDITSHIFDLDEVDDAIACAARIDPGIVKVLVRGV